MDLSTHRARPLVAADVEEADLLVVMDGKNLEDLVGRFPSAVDKVILLGLVAGKPTITVPDPISLDEQGIRRSVDLVRDAVTRLTSD